MIHPDDRTQALKKIEEDIQIKKSHLSEHRIICFNGDQRWVQVKGQFKLDSEGNVDRLYGTIHDITENKKSQLAIKAAALRLRKANKIKSLFNDILSHDIMNMAFAITIASQPLSKKETDPKKSKVINNITRSAEYLIDLCNSATKYAKVTSTKQIEFSEYDLSKLLGHVLLNLEPLLLEKKIKVNADLDKAHIADVNLMMNDVFLNIISNAIKFSPKESTISLEITESANTCTVAISDQGDGIPDSFKKQIFNRFERVNTKGVKGTGLGLAIAKGIVDLHGGEVWAENNGNKGSVFFVKLWKHLPKVAV